MRRGLLAAAVAVACVTGTAAAQQPDKAGAGPPREGCELHIWPSQGLRSVYHGWFRGAINDGAVTGRDGYPVVPADPVDTAQQVKLMHTLDVPTAIGLAGYKQVIHDTALDTRSIRTSTTRLTNSPSPCYAELIADDVFFQQDVVTGRYLKILFRYRDFGADPSPRRVFGTFVETELKVFPPTAPEQNAAALDELHAAFVGNFAKFAVALNKPPKTKR